MNRAADDEHTKEHLVALHREGYALEALAKVINAAGGSLDLYELGGLCTALEDLGVSIQKRASQMLARLGLDPYGHPVTEDGTRVADESGEQDG